MVGRGRRIQREIGGPNHVVRAAQYVRMSTDHQQYSTQNQADAIRVYAVKHDIQIVKTYADEGKSGLNIERRDALKQLIEDVQGGRAEFDIILVYDVSRWGRFQDPDEGAFYEQICKQAGITVQFCAEQFVNDGSPVSTIIKGVKRAMAGEYSRELSAKVFAGQRRLIELGFRQGGQPGYGLRRRLVDHAGVDKGILDFRQQKSIQTDRVVLTAGPQGEVDVVREIYRRFVSDNQSENVIAETLNARGLVTDLGRPWTRGTVHQVLINEKYIGNNVWNRVSFKLKQRRVHNTSDTWVRAEGVFPAIVAREIFDAAQTIIKVRSFRLSDEEMLDALRRLRSKLGALSGLAIDEAEGLPSSSAYRSRFGSLLRAYHLVGYTPRRDYRYIEINRTLRAYHPGVVTDILARLRQAGCRPIQGPTTQLISIDDTLAISVIIARCRHTPGGAYRWRLRFDTSLEPDVTIAVRMDAHNRCPLDYYLFPRLDLAAKQLKLAEDNGLALDGYRFDSLDPFYEFMTPIQIVEAA